MTTRVELQLAVELLFLFVRSVKKCLRLCMLKKGLQLAWNKDDD